MSFTAVGKPFGHIEGPAKVTGAAAYTADLRFPATIWGKSLRSPLPHARIVRNFGLRSQQDVTILASGGNVARIAALKQGAVDAALISSPDDIRAMREGFKILLDAGTYFRLPFGGISTTVANIRKNPAEVGRVVRAVVRAVQAMADPRNRDSVITYLVNFFKLERADATEFYTRLIPSLSPTGIVDRDKINLVIDSAVERGLTQKPLDPDHVVDFSFAKSVR